MACRKAEAYSLPPEIAERVRRFAEKRNQTKSEVARAALPRFLDEEEEWEGRWKRLRSYGSKKMREKGIRGEQEVYDVVYELRHGRSAPESPSPSHAPTKRRR